MKTIDILRSLYGVRPRRYRFRRFMQRVRLRILQLLQRYSWRLALFALVFFSWAAGHVYFYNRLTMLEFDVKAAWAQVETVQQKRNHIQRSLVRVLRYYENYERGVVTDVAKIRAGKTDVDEGEEATAERGWKLLGDLNAVAEAYPNLYLTNTVQQFTNAIIHTESEIALRISEYNGAVNRYTSVLYMFPGNIFAKANGFETYEFYEPEDRAILEYREVDLP